MHTLHLTDIDLLDATHGWAVGHNGTALRWDGQVWLAVATPAPGKALFGVAILSPTDAWAVGIDGYSGLILHWDGQAWTRWHSSADDFLTN